MVTSFGPTSDLVLAGFKTHCEEAGRLSIGGGFKICFMSTRKFREYSHFDSYFSTGLVQPATRKPLIGIPIIRMKIGGFNIFSPRKLGND